MRMFNSQVLSNMTVFQPPFLPNNLAKETCQHIASSVNYMQSLGQAWMLFGGMTF